MALRVSSELLLVGSLPAESTDAAFRAGAELFGDMMFALPDGETGPRGYLRSEDEGFFEPLADLSPGSARPYPGIVLPVDGVPGLERRHATASKYLSDFGVAMYCGFGRQPGEDGMETMREHRRVVASLRS